MASAGVVPANVSTLFWSAIGVVALVAGVWSLVDHDWLELVAMAFMVLASVRGLYVARRS